MDVQPRCHDVVGEPMNGPLTDAQIAQIFAPKQLGIHGHSDWDKLERGCQRLIDHYTVAGTYTSAALTLAIVCKHLIREVRDRHVCDGRLAGE